MYVKFLNRILVKYNSQKEIYEEYKKISNHKFEDEELQKIYDDKLYETLSTLPKLREIIISYSEKEEYDSVEAKKEELKDDEQDISGVIDNNQTKSTEKSSSETTDERIDS